ncbi:MAG: hypothetical protein JO079_10335 [Frankiaceae bacterium]|nr:hypothetical protein [Frankiaceae bacterium]
MRHRKVAAGLTGAMSIALSVGLLSTSAYADYAPNTNDAVGVGSDTVQYAIDFGADGDFLSDAGFNSNAPKYRLINFDATPDANARLAYGANGASTSTCAPGTGGSKGTGNQSAVHTDKPCTLNPTIVLRAGTRPVQRPNGSGAGGALLGRDSLHLVDFSRASACQGPSATCSSSNANNLTTAFDSIQIGSDPLQMLETTTPASNAVPLSATQLNLIYSCQATTWNDARIGGTSGNTIIPILPQVGSGTRSSFLSNIGNPTVGGCVQNAEENDPFGLFSVADAVGGSAADAIEPMSGGRLNLFLGRNGSSVSNGGGPAGAAEPYFMDPSCQAETASVTSGVGTAGECPATVDNGATGQLVPAVQFITGTPTGTPAPGSLFGINRPLYIYFRDADLAVTGPSSSGGWEPGSTLNLVRKLFYNPCSGTGHTTGCVTISGTTYGPGGQPYFATAAGQALISAAGISPTYVPTLGGP